MSGADLPAEVRAAADRIRCAMRKQEAEMIESFGTALGPPKPQVERSDLLAVLDHLGINEPSAGPGTCGEPIELWEVETYCVRDAGHQLDSDNGHRNPYGIEWSPVPRGGDTR